MLDEIFINRFLTKSYTVFFKDGTFCFKDKISDKKYTPTEFKNLFEKIFTYELTDDFKPPLTVVQIWLDARKFEITEKIYDYLSNCKVKLGKFNWEIYDSIGKFITEKDIFALAGDNDTGQLYIKIFNDWYEDEIYKVSSKMMINYE